MGAHGDWGHKIGLVDRNQKPQFYGHHYSEDPQEHGDSRGD